MALENKSGLKRVETDVEEMERQIKEHRKRTIRKSAIVITLLVLVVMVGALWSALMTYQDYEITESTSLHTSSASKYTKFGDCMITYSNDGIACRSFDMELKWNQSYEMNSPHTECCGDYMVVYDKGGSSLYIIGNEGVIKEISTNQPIQKVSIADHGIVAVLMKEEMTAYLSVFDQTGAELASGKFFGEKGSFPIDIALSTNGQMLAVDFVDLTDANLNTTISFYNFGSVGQNEIDNNVGTYTYKDMIVSSMSYVSENRMFAVSDHSILVFEGSQKPKLAREIPVEHGISSIFYDSKYIGITYANDSDVISYHISIYNYMGNSVLEKDTAIAYDSIEFLKYHEICLLNSDECSIYTIHGVEKFSKKFEDGIQKVYGCMGSRDYIFVSGKEAQEVKLK